MVRVVTRLLRDSHDSRRDRRPTEPLRSGVRAMSPPLATFLRSGWSGVCGAAVCGAAVCSAGIWHRTVARAAVPAAAPSQAMSTEPEPEPSVDVGSMVAANIAAVNERIAAKCAAVGRGKVRENLLGLCAAALSPPPDGGLPAAGCRVCAARTRRSVQDEAAGIRHCGAGCWAVRFRRELHPGTAGEIRCTRGQQGCQVRPSTHQLTRTRPRYTIAPN